MQRDADTGLEGTVLGGKYELVRRIGAGGMGEVYRGKQLSTGGRVAVKLMDARDRPEKTLARFRYEAETTAQLTHPNTVRILDFGGEKDLLYLVMEYLSGTDLTRFLRPGGQADPFVAHVLFQVACSLTEAHSRGVIHRDIKPNNIMLLQHIGHPSFVKVIDFGIARAIAGPGHGTRGILGTIGYIAPEAVHENAQPDTRTDLYSLGCVAYELLTGRLPFDGITHQSAPMDILDAHMNGQPRHILDVKSEVDDELSELVMSLLSRDPDDRPKIAGDLVLPLHGVRSRVSDGVAFSIDIAKGPQVDPDAQRHHADVGNLPSSQIAWIPDTLHADQEQDGTPAGESPPSEIRPTQADRPQALHAVSETLEADNVQARALLRPQEQTPSAVPDRAAPNTEQDSARRPLDRSDNGGAVPGQAVSGDRVSSIDPKGPTADAIPTTTEQQDAWTWSSVPPDAEQNTPIESGQDAFLPKVILGVALLGIMAWFIFGR